MNSIDLLRYVVVVFGTALVTWMITRAVFTASSRRIRDLARLKKRLQTRSVVFVTSSPSLIHEALRLTSSLGFIALSAEAVLHAEDAEHLSLETMELIALSDELWYFGEMDSNMKDDIAFARNLAIPVIDGKALVGGSESSEGVIISNMDYHELNKRLYKTVKKNIADNAKETALEMKRLFDEICIDCKEHCPFKSSFGCMRPNEDGEQKEDRTQGEVE